MKNDRVFVANSSTYPELTHLAAGLISCGYETTYATSTSWARNSLLARVTQSSVLRRTWVGNQMRRRLLPDSIRADHIAAAARLQEVSFQLASRLAPSRRGAALRARLDTFARQAAAKVDRTVPRVIVAQYHSAEALFSADGASEAFKVLGYPIAHHRWIEKTYTEEQLRNPDWAAYLYAFAPTSEEVLASLDREIALADLILVPSSFAKETFMEHGVEEKRLAVHPLGTSISTPEGSRDSSAYQLWSPHAKLRVLFVGLVTQRKGISYLIDAVQSVDGAELLVVGDPVPGIAKMIPDSVRMIRSSPRDYLAQVMRAADVLVLPSLAEGFPLVAIEAMSVGTPCILSTSTFAQDVVDDGTSGIIVEPGNSAQIAKALVRLRDDRVLLHDMGDAAIRAAHPFTWDRYAASVIDDLVSRGELRLPTKSG